MKRRPAAFSSKKRYALFNLTEKNQPVLRKASAHGLGHLMEPYSKKEAPSDIPLPSVQLEALGVRRWQYDLWYKIVKAARRGDPDKVKLDWHPVLHTPAAIRYGASSPRLRSWLDRWNDNKQYEDQVRPYGFLLPFTPRRGPLAPFAETLVGRSHCGRQPRTDKLAPTAAYDRNPKRTCSEVFDRRTGKPIRPDQLMTYAHVIAQYHLSSELKFDNGEFLNRGRTERRHVVAIGIDWIGKEANRVGDSGEPDPVSMTTPVLKRAR